MQPRLAGQSLDESRRQVKLGRSPADQGRAAHRTLHVTDGDLGPETREQHVRGSKGSPWPRVLF